MKKFNHFIKKTKLNNEYVYFNTVTKKILNVNDSYESFENNSFLQHQEDDVVKNYLGKISDKLIITIVPTIRCNLRCSHCVVLNELDNKDFSRLDINNFYAFFERLIEFTGQKQCTINFVGGEPLLEAKYCLDLINGYKKIVEKNEIKSILTLTTNAAMCITSDMIDLLKDMDEFIVSLDGVKDIHNEQRKSIDKSIDPYEQTIENIKLFLDLGLNFKIQAAVKDKHQNDKEHSDFLRVLMKMGVDPENIKYGCVHPTVNNPEPNDSFSSYLKELPIRQIPCCKYRLMGSFCIDTKENVYSNYYTKNQNSLLGKLTTNIEEIKEEYSKSINQMPSLHDDKCKKCPVIGYCWGGCVNGMIEKPSDYCNQKGLIESVELSAKAGNLII